MTKMAKNFKPRPKRPWRKLGVGAIRVDDQGRKVYWECQHMIVMDHDLVAAGKPCLKCRAALEAEDVGSKRNDIFRRRRRAPGSFESNSR
jgi:hypothetical protein